MPRSFEIAGSTVLFTKQRIRLNQNRHTLRFVWMCVVTDQLSRWTFSGMESLMRSFYQLISSLASKSRVAGMCPSLLKGSDMCLMMSFFGGSRFRYRRSKY